MKKNIDPDNHGRNRNQKQPTTVEARIVDQVKYGTSATIEGKAKSEKGNNRSAGKGLEPNSTQQNEKKIVKTAVQYVRSATDSPESIRAQLRETARYAKEHGYRIVGRAFVDNGFGGYAALNRPAFLEMLKQIESGKANYTHILMTDISRLGRFSNPGVGDHYESLCNAHGVTIVYTCKESEIDRSFAEPFSRSLNRAMSTNPKTVSVEDRSR